jgi:endogenous inhibitor of DNA gyrase (YacG/DUF329 family)
MKLIVALEPVFRVVRIKTRCGANARAYQYSPCLPFCATQAKLV